MSTTEQLRAELERRPTPRVASARVALPAGGRWRAAEVRVVWQAAWPGPAFDVEATAYQLVEHQLVLFDARGEHPFVLDRHYLGSAADGIQVPWPDFQALLDARYQILAALDGHALALSTDGGATLRYAGLDAGAEPLWCPHRTWRPAPGDPFAGAPTTRALALEIFAATDPAVPSIHRGPDGPSVARFERELRPAGAFACLHPTDAEIVRAFATALVSERSYLTSADERPLLDCLGAIARTDPAVRAVFLAALARAGAAHELARTRAADVLGAGDGPDAQQALAGALTREDFDPGEGCRTLSAFTAALARLTMTRKAAGDEARRALVTIAAGRLPAKPGCAPEAPAHADARANAIRGLAAIARVDAEALAALRDLGRAPCEPSPWSPAPLPAWTAELQGARDAAGNRYASACWARAALQSLGEPPDAGGR
jgi:hypothetical protein